MIDEDFNVWLIEVNTNPALQESSLYLKNLIPRMIDDMMKLTIDKVFLPFYKEVVQEGSRVTQEQLDEMLNMPSKPVKELSPQENVWKKLMNIHNKAQRRMGKLEYLQPIPIRSNYQFVVKNRELKVKKYLNLHQ